MHNFVTAATNLMVFLIGLRACSSIPVFKRLGIILTCALVMSYTLKEPDMMFTNALNGTNNNQISRDCQIESGSGVNSRKKGSRKLETT